MNENVMQKKKKKEKNNLYFYCWKQKERNKKERKKKEIEGCKLARIYTALKYDVNLIEFSRIINSNHF